MTPRDATDVVYDAIMSVPTYRSNLERATAAIEALHSAGYRILGPGEWDAETVEKCAEEAEEYASYEQTEWGMGHRDACNSIAIAIRALAKEKQG